MIVYNVIWNDRHTDVEAIPFMDQSEAISWARKRAVESCSFEEDFKEEHNGAWIYYVQYSCEGDALWVTEHEVK